MLLSAATVACQAVEHVQAGREMSAAVDELLSWESLTIGAGIDATPEEVAAYLDAVTARDGGAPATPGQARLLAELELTVAVGDPDRERRMRDLGPDDELDGAMTVNFGGRDVAGVKNIEDRTYVRVGAQSIVDDVYGGDEAAVAAAARFEEDAQELPSSVGAAAGALHGNWTEIDPYLLDDYAAALHEAGGVDEAAAGRLGTALVDGASLLVPETQLALADALGDALRSGGELHRRGDADGAEQVDVSLPAADAWRALDPLLGVMTEQLRQFGLPPLVTAPDEEDGGRVTARLQIRNGVLTDATVDLAQFGGAAAAAEAADGASALPLHLSLAGGSALSLKPPESDGPLDPAELTVALMYLRVQAEERAEDPDRADVPGPMQP
ncbi:hypothetical protein [Streptomyces sp. NPDC049881]|uniref:hypothetical protein n=1 Tax=Streptomyces sp. NPDC049881 TaxID=3155778 RepID=UPI003435BD96